MSKELEKAAKEYAGSNYIENHFPKAWNDRYIAFIAGCKSEAAKEYWQVQGMRWVKANEYAAKNWSRLHFRDALKKYPLAQRVAHDRLLYGEDDTVEWLEELSTPPSSDKVKENNLIEVLQECEDYFDNKADADHDENGYIPNEEMNLLVRIKAALNNTNKNNNP